MTRAVLPNTLAVEEWFLAGSIDRALSHWVRAPPLDGGDDDDDADTVNTSFLSRFNNLPFCSSQTSGRCSLAPHGGCLLSDVSARFGTRSSLRKLRRMFWRHHRIPRPRAGAP